MQMELVKINDFRQITPYNSKKLTTASVVYLVRSQVYHTERPPLRLFAANCRDAARRAGTSATADVCITKK